MENIEKTIQQVSELKNRLREFSKSLHDFQLGEDISDVNKLEKLLDLVEIDTDLPLEEKQKELIRSMKKIILHLTDIASTQNKINKSLILSLIEDTISINEIFIEQFERILEDYKETKIYLGKHMVEKENQERFSFFDYLPKKGSVSYFLLFLSGFLLALSLAIYMVDNSDNTDDYIGIAKETVKRNGK